MLQLTGKRCTICKTWKPFSEFHARKDRPGKFVSKCKQCCVAYTREWKKKNPDKVSEYGKTHYQKHRTTIRQKARKWYEQNREELLLSMREDRKGKDAYLKLMLKSAKTRAKKKEWEFDLDAEYLESIATDHCPIDGKAFDWGRKMAEDDSLDLAVPSLDRVDSSRGYVKGNVRIIGKNWNSKKSNMSLADLLLLVKYVRNATEAENPDHF